MNKFCITFAGVPGSSKTPIASYLSYELGLPAFNNDVLRTEVLEDLKEFNQNEYEKRRDERLKDLLGRGVCFIYDASVDREWDKLKSWLEEAGYEWFVISLDFSYEFMQRLQETKGYTESIQSLDESVKQHRKFVMDYSSDIGFHLTDDQFPNRLAVCLDAAKRWLPKGN